MILFVDIPPSSRFSLFSSRFGHHDFISFSFFIFIYMPTDLLMHTRLFNPSAHTSNVRALLSILFPNLRLALPYLFNRSCLVFLRNT